MNSIIQQITDWLKGLLVSGIMNNLTNTFSSVNDQVGQIATEVGQTPSSFLPAVFNMVRNLSETVIMPIAGILLTFIACYELIQLIISYNNLAMEFAQCTPSLSQALRIKKLSTEGKLTVQDMEDILSEIKQKDIDRVVFKNEQLHRFFPTSYTAEQMRREILEMLKMNMNKYWDE